MPINPGIIGQLNTKPLDFGNPVQDYAQVQNLRHLMLQGNEQERIANENQADSNALRQSGGDIATYRQNLANAGLAKRLQEVDAKILANRVSQSTIDKNSSQSNNFNSEIKKRDDEAAFQQRARTAQGILSHDTYESAMTPLEAALARTDLPPAGRQHLETIKTRLEATKGNPEAFNKERNAIALETLAPDRFAAAIAPTPQVIQEKLGDRNVVSTVEPKSGVKKVISTSPIAPSPNTLAPVSQTSIDLDKVTPAELEAANRWKNFGELPPNMGRGVQGAAQATRIRDIAAALNTKEGLDPTDAAARQSGGKKTMADFSGSGKSAIEVKAANTALNHIETLRELAKAQAIADKTGDFQPFNRIANAAKTMFGGTAPANLQAAVTMVGPELTRSFAGANTALADREHTIQAMNNKAASPEQFNGVLDQATDLLGGRLQENERVYARTGLKDFRTSKYLSPAAIKVLETKAPITQQTPTAQQSANLPMPKDKSALVPNKIYDTSRGPAKWNGVSFEPQ